MISFHSLLSRVSSFPSVVLLYLALLSTDHSYIPSSPVSFDDALHENVEQFSYLRCQLHTHPFRHTGNHILSHRCDIDANSIKTAISDNLF